jgi:hypothetical protein
MGLEHKFVIRSHQEPFAGGLDPSAQTSPLGSQRVQDQTGLPDTLSASGTFLGSGLRCVFPV